MDVQDQLDIGCVDLILLIHQQLLGGVDVIKYDSKQLILLIVKFIL